MRVTIVLAVAVGVAVGPAHPLARALAAGGGAEARPAAPAREPDVIFVPTPEPAIDAMLDLARVGPEDVVWDLGCGDGRIVIAAARRGARRAVGVDIDPARIREARENARRAGLGDRVRFVEGDLFDQDLAGATVVALYLLPELNDRLAPRLRRLPPGTRIVSHAFGMVGWKPDATRIVDGKEVFLWIVRGAR